MPCHVNSFAHADSVLPEALLKNPRQFRLQAFVKHWRQGKLSAEKETVGEVQVRSFLFVYIRPPVRSSGTVSSKEVLLNSEMFILSFFVNLLDMFLHVMLCHTLRRILSQQ